MTVYAKQRKKTPFWTKQNVFFYFLGGFFSWGTASISSEKHMLRDLTDLVINIHPMAVNTYQKEWQNSSASAACENVQIFANTAASYAEPYVVHSCPEGQQQSSWLVFTQLFTLFVSLCLTFLLLCSNHQSLLRNQSKDVEAWADEKIEFAPPTESIL